jgi:putative transposase
MKKSKFTEQQIAFALQQAEGGTPVAEVCRKMGISEEDTPLQSKTCQTGCNG